MMREQIADSPPYSIGTFRTHMHLLRRMSQVLFLLALVMAPILGLFRIDVLTGAFVIGDYQIWFSDFFIVIGVWIFIASLLVLTYSWVGAAFCGWLCPQGFLSELGTNLMRKLLGRRAGLEIDGSGVQVASRKKGVGNWIILGVAFLLGAMFLALIPLFYFYPPKAVWHFITFTRDPQMPLSIYWIYFVFVVVMLVDIAMIRHVMCRYFCVYRIWQHSFKTTRTLAIGYDDTRSDECVKCGYCLKSCAVDLDPRNTELYSGCTACGECIVACDKLHSRQDDNGLLSFVFPEGKKKGSRLSTAASRLRGVLPATAVGAAMFIFGIMHYQSYHLSVGNIGSRYGNAYTYAIHLANKRYRPSDMHIRVEGLKPDQYHLESKTVHFNSAGIRDVALRLNQSKLGLGLISFSVHVTTNNGWSDTFPVRYFAVGDRH